MNLVWNKQILYSSSYTTDYHKFEFKVFNEISGGKAYIATIERHDLLIKKGQKQKSIIVGTYRGTVTKCKRLIEKYYQEIRDNETAKNQKPAIILQAHNTRGVSSRFPLGGACLLDCKETANEPKMEKIHQG